MFGRRSESDLEGPRGFPKMREQRRPFTVEVRRSKRRIDPKGGGEPRENPASALLEEIASVARGEALPLESVDEEHGELLRRVFGGKLTGAGRTGEGAGGEVPPRRILQSLVEDESAFGGPFVRLDRVKAAEHRAAEASASTVERREIVKVDTTPATAERSSAVDHGSGHGAGDAEPPSGIVEAVLRQIGPWRERGHGNAGQRWTRRLRLWPWSW